MNRKLAVPLAINKVSNGNRVIRTRILKNDDVLDDLEVVTKLAEIRASLDRLARDLDQSQVFEEAPSFTTDMDYMKADIELDLLGLTAELEETPYAEEILEEVAA